MDWLSHCPSIFSPWVLLAWQTCNYGLRIQGRSSIFLHNAYPSCMNHLSILLHICNTRTLKHRKQSEPLQPRSHVRKTTAYFADPQRLNAVSAQNPDMRGCWGVFLYLLLQPYPAQHSSKCHSAHSMAPKNIFAMIKDSYFKPYQTVLLL